MAAAFEAAAALETEETAVPTEHVAAPVSEPTPGPVRGLRTAHDISGPRTRTGDVLLAEPADFESLLLSRPVLEGLRAAGFERPSPVQLKAIPLGRCGLGEGGDPGEAEGGRRTAAAWSGGSPGSAASAGLGRGLGAACVLAPAPTFVKQSRGIEFKHS